MEEVGEGSLALEGVLSFGGFLVVGGGDFGVALVDAAVAGCFSLLGGSLFWFAVGWLPDFLFLDFPMVSYYLVLRLSWIVRMVGTSEIENMVRSWFVVIPSCLSGLHGPEFLADRLIGDSSSR